MFIFSYALFSEFLLLNCFFTWAGSTGVALKFHEWATGSEQLAFVFTTPFKFPETESKHMTSLPLFVL